MIFFRFMDGMNVVVMHMMRAAITPKTMVMVVIMSMVTIKVIMTMVTIVMIMTMVTIMVIMVCQGPDRITAVSPQGVQSAHCQVFYLNIYFIFSSLLFNFGATQ